MISFLSEAITYSKDYLVADKNEEKVLYFLVKIMHVSRKMVLAKRASWPLKHKIILYNSVSSINEPSFVLITALIVLS
jgi:hypothetical protein